MSTETVPEIDVDLNADLPCDNPIHDNPASWMVTRTCRCHLSQLSCDTCRFLVLEELASYAGTQMRCGDCGDVVPIDTYFTWRRL